VDGPEVKYRIPDLILMVALVVGGVLAWQSARERARLKVDYERLVRATGDLPISDPTKAHFRALETGEPLHFAWRVYLPPNYSMIVRSNGGTGNYSGSGSQDLIARVRFRPDDAGNWEVFRIFAGSSSRGKFCGKELAGLLKGRTDKILVEQLGAKEIAMVEPKGSAVVLRLTLPEAMQAEARKTLPEYEQHRFIPDLFRLEIGPEKPKPAPPPPGS
jgi:hypothetical protein